MKKPKITIGVCIKDAETTLKDTINSILDQDYPLELMEIIFIDDGSEDNTLSILNSFLKSTNLNTKLYHHEWKGLGASRNIVYRNAKADYILWVDGDMMLSKDYTKKMMDFMEKNPKIGVAKGKYSLTQGPNWISTLEIYSRYAHNLADYNQTTNSLGTGGSIYRVEAIRQVNGFDEKIKGYGEDQDIENRIRKVGWSFGIIDVEFKDYERYKLNWKDLWNKYFKRGHDVYFLINLNKSYLDLYKMTPPFFICAGMLNAILVYKINRDKLAFLLPLHTTIKMMAWGLGLFIAAYKK